MLQRMSLLLLVMLVGAACQTAAVQIPDVEGDPANGEVLFAETINGAPSCASCHNLDQQAKVGPGLGGYAEVAITRVEGQSAEEYTYNSIVNVSAYLVPGYANLMYSFYSTKLDDQQIMDLTAYMLTLE